MTRHVGHVRSHKGRTGGYAPAGEPGALDPPEVRLVAAMFDLTRVELGKSAAILVRGELHPNPDRVEALAWLDEAAPTPKAVALAPRCYDPDYGEWKGSFRWWCKVAGMDEGQIRQLRTQMKAIKPQMRPTRRGRVKGWADAS